MADLRCKKELETGFVMANIQKKNIVVFLESKLEKTIKRNYTFTLRIKSNLDSGAIQERFNVKYLKFTNLKMKDIVEGDVFIFFKSHFFLRSTKKLIQIIKAYGKKVIYDIDDYYLVIPDYSFSKHLNKGKRVEIFRTNLLLSDWIVVSTEPLSEQFVQYNKNVKVIENTLQFKDREKIPDKTKIVTILVTSSDNLKINIFKNDFVKCLYDIKNKYKEKVKIVFLGKFSNVDNITSLADEFIDRIPPEEYQDYLIKGNFNIGLVPLGGEEDPETLLSHSCKSNIKFLEFADFAIAGVYSNVKPYQDIVNYKEGLIVNNNYSEWFSAISDLIQNEQLRNDIIINSRKKFENNFSKKISQEKYLHLFNNMNCCESETDILKNSNITSLVNLLHVKYLFLANIASQKIVFVFMLIRNGEFREIWNRVLARLRG